jgi:hypothetical protein
MTHPTTQAPAHLAATGTTEVTEADNQSETGSVAKTR